MTRMRIFTGIILSAEAREKILKALKPFKKAGTPIRWTAEPNMHMTLKFIGDVDEPLATKVAEALLREKPAVAPFCLCLRGFGKFPVGDDLHVFWAGVEESPELRTLFTGVEAALLPLGIARDTRPFQPHLTLGRNKANYNFKGLYGLLAEWRERFLAEWPVSAFHLFSSRLTPAGPVYTVLKEIDLVQP
jgi:2'-5' RNA ligase